MDFTAYSLSQQTTIILNTHIMSRQNRNQVRDGKTEAPKRDVANSNDRFPRHTREHSQSQPDRNDRVPMAEMDRYRLNDLYERSSL